MSDSEDHASDNLPLISSEEGLNITSNPEVAKPVTPIGWGGILVVDTLAILRRSWLPLLILALVVLIVDIAVFVKNLQSPQVRNVDISLSGSSAVVKSNGFVDKSSLTSSFDVNGGSCDYFYRKTQADEWVKGGQLLAVLPVDGNNQHEFNVEVRAEDTEYGTLRRIFWDLSSSGTIDSGVRMECAIELSAQVYRVIPVSYTYKFSQSVDMKTLRKNAVKTLKSQQDVGTKKPSISLVPTDVSLGQANFQLIVNLHKKPKLVINHETLESFVVRIPQLSYATSFVDATNAGNNYLVVQSGAAVFDLAQYAKPIAIDISLDCTPVAETKEEALAQIGTGKCVLTSPLNFQSFTTELENNKYLNVAAEGNVNNFIMSLLGEFHFLRTVDNALFPGNQQESSSYARALSTDPAISTGANCVTVDADGIYLTQTCAQVEGDFFKLFMEVYGDSSYVGEIDFVTSWAPASEEVAFDSNLQASFLTGGNMYDVKSELFFSQNLKELEFKASLNQSNPTSWVELYNQEVNATWSITGSTGTVKSNSTTSISGMETAIAYGQFYFNNGYFTSEVKGYDDSYPNPGDLVDVVATGGYNFDPSSWVLLLSEGTLDYQMSRVGNASADIVFYTSNDDDWKSDTFAVNFYVDDADYNVVVASPYTMLGWSSTDNFASDGSIFTASLFELYNGDYPELSWNVTGIVDYLDHEYAVGAFYNPMDLSPIVQSAAVVPTPFTFSDPASLNSFVRVQHSEMLSSVSSSVDRQSRRLQTSWFLDNVFLLYGFGRYGGNAEDLHVSLDDSVVVLYNEYLGFAAGNFSYDFSTPSESGDVVIDFMLQDGTHGMVFENHGNYAYSVSSAQGIVSASSAVNVYGTGIQWNVTTYVSYGDNAYEAFFAENNYGVNDENVLVNAAGGYGGNWDSWWVSVTDSEFISFGSLIGHGLIELKSSSADGGNSANTTYVAVYTDANNVPAVHSVQHLSWDINPESANGALAIYSHWDYMQSFAYNVSAAFAYGDNAFAITVDETDMLNGIAGSLTALGTGNYHGNSTNWGAALTQSSLVVTGSTVGSAEGSITGFTPDSWTNGNVQLDYVVLDASDSQVLTSSSTSSWSTSSNWNVDGALNLKSLIDVVGSKTLNTTGVFTYGGNAYHFGILEDIFSGSDLENLNAFELTVTGNYIFDSANKWMIDVTNSIMQSSDQLYFNARGMVQSVFAYSGDFASFVFAFVDYVDDNEMSYSDGEYPQGDSAFWTINRLGWNYDGEVAEGYLLTNSSVYTESAFTLNSLVYSNLINETAYFSVAESLSGVDGLDVWIAGDYDMETGMLAKIGAQVGYEGTVYFGSTTTYDLQLETIDQPTFAPTAAPTIYSDAPSVAPTMAPSVAPTLSPSAMPTIVPTMAPSAAPTVAPSAMPTLVPTAAPTIYSDAPTLSPTQIPTAVPTVAPSAAPTAAPTTSQPTVSPTPQPTLVSDYPTMSPTVVPTISPTPVPTASPTLYPTIVFTQSPTVANAPTITFSASQVISGIDLATFNSNLEANTNALTVTIAGCMTGVAPTDVHNLVVTGARRRLNVRVQMDVNVLSGSISASYTILVTGYGLSYSSLSAELSSSVSSGTFTTLLQENAVAYGAADLGSASSSSVSTVNLTPSSSNNKLSGGAIAGIVIGVVFGTAIIAGVAYYFAFMYQGSAGEASAVFSKGGTSKENPIRDDFVTHENVARDKLRNGRSPQKGTADDDL